MVYTLFQFYITYSKYFRDVNDFRQLSRVQEPSALEIAAEQMRLLPTMEPNKQKV